MVWFQCEDCGENLKKPKLANHFRICSAHKLSCIDCGVFFSKESVQTHTQCMTEAEKYGPKDQGKPSQNSNSKPEKPKKNADVDITVGLSLRPPWFCSLCNTPTTSKQTLLLHADGKKHRAKARAFLAAQKQSNQTEVTQDKEKESAFASPKLEPVKVNDMVLVGARQVHEKKSHEKRKHDEVGGTIVNGEVIRAEEEGGKSRSKKNKIAEMLPSSNNHHLDDGGVTLKKKIKWKKLIVSTLASKPAGAMKINKLQKLVIRNLEASGIAGDEGRLCDAMMEKINSSSRFIINGELICLAAKTNN